MDKKMIIGLVVVVAVAIGGFFLWRSLDLKTATMDQQGGEQQNVQNDQQGTTTIPADVTDLGGGLFIRDITVGTGAEAVNGKRVYAKYVGRLTDGTVFDASELHPETKDAGFSFVLGNDQVIQGWHKGIVGMKVGGQRLIQVPPELGYGAQAYGPIPANSTLVFAIELVKVE